MHWKMRYKLESNAKVTLENYWTSRWFKFEAQNILYGAKVCKEGKQSDVS